MQYSMAASTNGPDTAAAAAAAAADDAVEDELFASLKPSAPSPLALLLPLPEKGEDSDHGATPSITLVGNTADHIWRIFLPDQTVPTV